MPTPAALERAALLDLFEQTGPHAATLCEGWTTHDLAAHLVARERQPLAGPGLVLPPLHPVTAFFERRERARPYADLIAVLRAGAPLLSVGRFDGVELSEWYVHHEDVRRLVTPGPRAADPDLQEALWARLAGVGRVLTVPARVLTVILANPDGRRQTVRTGGGQVVLSGAPTELMMWLFGRRSVADVEVQAGPDTLALARSAWPGL